MKKGGIAIFNSVSGRPRGFANVDMVQFIHIEERDKNLQPFKEKVHLWNTVRELKDKISITTGYPVQRQRLFYNNMELENSKTLDSYNLLTKRNSKLSRHQQYIAVILKLRPDIEQMASYIDSYGSLACPRKLKIALEKVRQGFNSGLIPQLTDDGTSGTYKLRNAQRNLVSIFKPIDEEPFAPNNPRGHCGLFGSQTFRPGVLSGESCVREVAAYILDEEGFSGVPQTTFVEVVHGSLKFIPFTGLDVNTSQYFDIIATLKVAEDTQIGMKFGSLQMFVKNEGPIENFSPDLFHIDEVHKIAILDLRILNLDRNETNILVTTKINKKKNKKVRTLIPIDHGLCIPDNLAICTYDIAWLSWRQAEIPFSRRSLAFIDSIDIINDIKKLENAFKFRPICLRNIRISSTLLKRAAAQNLNLSQIGQILCRPDEDESIPSLLEKIVEKARLIADMKTRLQTRIRDTNLRDIDKHKHHNDLLKDVRNSDDEEDTSFDKFASHNVRNFRKGSVYGDTNGATQQLKNHNFAQQPIQSQSFLSHLADKLGAEGGERKLFDAKKRGMSDVDDRNIKQLQNNTSNMIEDQIQRLQTKKFNDSDNEEEEEKKQQNEYASEYGEEEENDDNDDEFFDCLDDEKDINVLNGKQLISEEGQIVHSKSAGNGSTAASSVRDRVFSENPGKVMDKAKGLRKTASYSNIQIAEDENEDQEDEDQGNGKNNILSPEQMKMRQLRTLAKNDRFSKGASIMNEQARTAKSYFEHGSIRDTAHDEEFFHIFEQYLDEAIAKLKLTWGTNSNGNAEGGEEVGDDSGEHDYDA